MKGMKIYGSFYADSYQEVSNRLANGNTKI